MKKDIEVRCPDCGSKILVDVRTGQVLRHQKKDKPKEKSVQFDAVVDDVHERRKKVPEAFDQAVDTVQKRTDGLDDLFDRALKKAEKEPQEDAEGGSGDDSARGSGG